MYGPIISIERETVVGNLNLASNYDYNHGEFIGYKRGTVALKRTWGPFIFIAKFKFL